MLLFLSSKVIESQGAVESLLERSSHVQLADGSLVPIDDQCRELLLRRLQEMSSKGLRCLGFAYNDELGEFSDYYADTHPAHKKLLDPTYYSSIESDLVFVGIIGLRVSLCHYLWINESINDHSFVMQLFEDIHLVHNNCVFVLIRTLLVRKFTKQLRIVRKLALELW